MTLGMPPARAPTTGTPLAMDSRTTKLGTRADTDGGRQAEKSQDVCVTGTHDARWDGLPGRVGKKAGESPSRQADCSQCDCSQCAGGTGRVSPQGFGVRGHAKDVGAGKGLREALPSKEAREDRVGPLEVLLQLILIGAFAHEGQARTGNC